MKIEVCDLCGKEVNECNSTKVIIKDYNGGHFDFGTAFPVKRRFTGVICDDCLKLLKERKHKQIPQTPIQDGYFDEPYVCPNCGQALKWEE